jgi:serine/threonine protein kinase
MPQQSSGQQIGSYRIVDLLGSGGMADVYLAVGPVGRVALKVVKAELVAEDDIREMFAQEARIAQQLAHPNIVRVLQCATSEKSPYLAMEYIDGVSLRDLQLREQQQRLTVGVALFIASEVCAALQHAHVQCDQRGQSLGLIHRDVSPHNILISSNGEVKLADFGIAKVREQAVVTAPGVLKGKVGYLSPEQAAGRPYDQRADIFAMGIVLYRMLTGVNPFASDEAAVSLRLTVEGTVDPPSYENPLVDPLVDKIVLRALAKSPQERYQSAAEMLSALKAAQRDLGLYVGQAELVQLVAGAKASGQSVTFIDEALAKVVDDGTADDVVTQPLRQNPSPVSALEGPTVASGKLVAASGDEEGRVEPPSKTEELAVERKKRSGPLLVVMLLAVVAAATLAAVLLLR